MESLASVRERKRGGSLRGDDGLHLNPLFRQHLNAFNRYNSVIAKHVVIGCLYPISGRKSCEQNNYQNIG